MARWELRFAREYLDDLRALLVFDRARVQTAVVNSLQAEPDKPSRHRRPLAAPVGWCPEAQWQLRVRDYRIPYRLQNSAVIEVLRVRLKARRTTEERLIAAYDGSPVAAKEIVRGLAAARSMSMDCTPFEDALAARHQALEAA